MLFKRTDCFECYTSIKVLPFTTEDYQSAKSVLQTKYSKTSEIVASNLQLIMQLPVFFGNIR